MPTSGRLKGCDNTEKRIVVITFGCQMNVRDSEVIAGLLTNNDYRLTNNEKEADIIIFNTCSVRQHAEDKVWSEIGRYRAKGPSLALRTNRAEKKIIGVIGCMAQNYKEAVFEKVPQVDFVVGPSDIAKTPEIIKQIREQKSEARGNSLFEFKIWETNGSVRPEEIYHTGFYSDKNHTYFYFQKFRI